jgi:holo-[acyl-carrier protein] synthase
MQIGCGTDIIHINRIERAIKRLGQPFLDRIWTVVEQNDCVGAGRFASLAARFAAKEAASKALGTGIGVSGVSWHDFEVRRIKSGQPVIELHSAAKKIFEDNGGKSISVSLSHEKDLAQAMCVILWETTVE